MMICEGVDDTIETRTKCFERLPLTKIPTERNRQPKTQNSRDPLNRIELQIHDDCAAAYRGDIVS